MEEKDRPSKKNTLLLPLLLILIGFLLVLGRFVDFGGILKLWPLLLFAALVPLVTTLARDPQSNSETLIPITTLVILGIYFLWLNYSSWDRVAGTWPIFIIAPGLGVLGSWLIIRERSQLLGAAVILLLGLLMFFRIAMERMGMGVNRYLFVGIIMMFAGVAGLVIKYRKKKPAPEAQRPSQD